VAPTPPSAVTLAQASHAERGDGAIAGIAGCPWPNDQLPGIQWIWGAPRQGSAPPAR